MIQFFDLSRSHDPLRSEFHDVLDRLIDSSEYILGPNVENFENKFSQYCQSSYSIATNSGTSALHLALEACGVSAGDEVITTPMTFIATAASISYLKATPIFVDVEPTTWTLDPKKIEAAITSRTKAIMPVHLHGLMADMPSIMEIAANYNLRVIEDAAQAHLASINNRYVGTFGDAAAFSFYPTKNMTSGEGGMIVLSNSALARTCRLLRNQGMEKKYHNEIPGYNLRMTDIHAAIGRVQLKKLDRMTDARIRNAEFLNSNLDSKFTPLTPNGFRHVFHQYTVRIKTDRLEFSNTLKNFGIGNDIYYPTQVHRLPSFAQELNLPETERATKEVLSLPVHPGLSKKDLNRIVKIFNNLTRLA